MITLVKDKTHVKVSSWEELFELPGYTSTLNPKEEQLKQIIGKYEFPTMDKCGLSNCQTNHNRGYIVSTETGKLTNLGNQCGKKHFGIEFTSLSKQFNRDFRDYQSRQKIERFLRDYDTYISKLALIEKNHGKVEDYYALQQFFTKPSKGCPESILSILQKMTKKKDPTIYSTRRITNEEYETLQSSGQNNISFFKEVPIGTLNGLPFLFNENNLRMFAIEYKTPFEKIINIDVNSLSSSELDSWSKRIGEFDGILNHTIEILQNGRKFCESQNVQKLEHFMSDEHKSWKQFSRFMNTKFNIIIR